MTRTREGHNGNTDSKSSDKGIPDAGINNFVSIHVRCTISDGQKQAIWDFFGGSCWEISDFLGDLLNVAQHRSIPDADFQDLLHEKMIYFRSMFVEYSTIEPEKEQLFLKIAELITDNPARGFTFNELRSLVEDGIWSISALRDELNSLVRNNFFSYAAPRAEYALQGRSMELGLDAYVKMIAPGGGRNPTGV
jgi:hypothetical protein